MPVPARFSQQHLGRKLMAAGVIALLAVGAALGAARIWPLSDVLRRADHLLYDAMYRARPVEDRTRGPVVIVAVDQKSLDAIDQWRHFGWPWPRDLWGAAVDYLSKAGAKAIVFDVLFTETSAYANEFDDDTTFAEQVKSAKSPVVFAAIVSPDGSTGRFALPLDRPIFGAANIGSDDVYRTYAPIVHGRPSLAAQAAAMMRPGSADGGNAPVIAADPFLLHYYGPHVSRDGRYTFRYVSAASVIAAAMGEAPADLDPSLFKDKLVLIGAITAGTFDVKASPLSAQYPGVEVQATAIENLLRGQRVATVGVMGQSLAAILASLAAGIGVIGPRRATFKVLGGALAAILIVAAALGLFIGSRIIWLPLAAPLLAVLVSTVGGFAWSYVTEDRQRRVMLKALATYVSPQVAEQISRDPARLALGGERRETTVLFTDIQGFTTLTETMEVEKLSAMLNYYLDEMSSVILAFDGTLDKYIGDAIMSFWNAPVDQPDHAMRACAAALGLRRRESEIQGELARLGARGMLTRIGLHSGAVAVGNMGSTRKFNYTVLGDTVNLASRLEGANKFYGTQVLLSEVTAELVRERFLLRKLDVLRVKGKTRPMAVYELIAERDGPDAAAWTERVERYERAFAAYQRQEWDQAAADLNQLLTRHPEDGPAKMLSERIVDFRAEPPGADWNGVYEAKEK